MKLRRYFCWLLGHEYKRVCSYPFSDTGTCVYCGDRVLFTSNAPHEDVVKAETLYREMLAEL